MKKHALLLSLPLIMTACAPQANPVLTNVAAQTSQDIACKSQKLEERVWDGLKNYLLEQHEMPTAESLKNAFQQEITKLAQANPQLSEEDQHKLLTHYNALADTLLTEAPAGERATSAEELLVLISALDVGDRSTTFRSYMQDKVQSQMHALQAITSQLNLHCEAAPEIPEKVEESLEQQAVTYNYNYHRQQALSRGEPLAVFGGRWAFATAYQTCQSVQEPDMDDATPDLKGVAVTGTHSDGVGSKRTIASLSQVQASHPYIKNVSAYGASCFNVRKNPLIYDYGGKPYASTSSSASINFFKNNGSGQSVLGIDCSAYVYSSMATAGLRLKEGRSLKASDSWAWGSTSYVEPAKNGLTCLSKISVKAAASIKAGDIVAVPGHVLLIDKAGADPFGLAKIKSQSGCSDISSDDFDFTVAQSSPSKGAVGINFFEAKAYLKTSAKMQAGLEKYAYYACLSKFTGKTYAPSLGTLSVVRHKGTSACMATRVSLTNEACVSSCASLSR